MKKYFWIIPVVIAFAVYSVAFNNFFTFDDFVWLHRAKTLRQNWLQMFHSEGLYFDPIVYLMFFIDYLVAGLDPRWYHTVDLMIHAVNSFLVYRFCNLLSGDEKASLYGSALFASSFAIADAVLWPSSRVDLVSVMFSLLALILFVKFLRTDNYRFLWMSCLMFVLALGAKGTPVVIPFILFWLTHTEGKANSKFISVVPFIVVVILYFAMLRLASQLPYTGMVNIKFHFNPRNLCLALDSLFIPERYLETLNPATTAVVLSIMVLPLGFLKFTSESSVRLRRTGVVIFVVALLPVLGLTDFKPATGIDHLDLLVSPSHRIYLASIGVALLGGGVLQSLEILCKRYSLKKAPLVITLFLLGLICLNAVEVRGRDLMWETEGDQKHLCLLELLDYRQRIVEDGFVGFVNFQGSRAFMNAMIKVFFNLKTITTEEVLHVGMTTEPEKLTRAERSSLFVMGNDLKVYDLSDQVQALLLTCKQASLNPAKPEYIAEINNITTQINQNIDEILQK